MFTIMVLVAEGSGFRTYKALVPALLPIGAMYFDTTGAQYEVIGYDGRERHNGGGHPAVDIEMFVRPVT